LIAALRAVARGDTYVDPQLTRYLIDGDLETTATPTADLAPWERLSSREREVLRMVALGHTNGEIAAAMFLSVKSIETYRHRGLRKLGLRTRAALVRFALERGLLDT
jgi:two-component system response regulator NreC